MLVTNIFPPVVRQASEAGAWALQIWTDEPLQITGPGPITLTMRSSDPARHADLLFTFLTLYSDLPNGQIGFQGTANFAGCAGVTFTLDAACTFVNWDQVQSLDGDPLPTDLSGKTGVTLVGVTGDLTATLAPLTLQAAGTVAGPRPLDSGSGVDNALIAKLGSDPILLGLCPNGVHWDLAPAGSTRFVIVSLVDAHDEPEFGGTAFEEHLYAIEARMVARAGTLTPIYEAADRIHTLLQDQPLAVPGYDWITLHRDTTGGTRIRKTEFDASDVGVFWYRRGGFYRAIMAPATG